MDVLSQLALSSDAEILAFAGAGFWLVAGFAAAMERKRGKRRSLQRLEKVGWMPWTAIFVGCMIIGGGMLAMSLPVVLGNL